MQIPRCQATIRSANRPWESPKDDLSSAQLVDISIIAAVAVALGLSGQLTARVTVENELANTVP